MIERDPISGNEVPLGAEPHEVRDNIDAKLSDGEYVLPADVVRYFGVQYIEKLVEKAKTGMEQLHADGRVNGTPPVQAATGGPIMDPRHGQYKNTQPQNDPPQQMSAAEQMRKHQRPVRMDEGGLAKRYPEIMNATPGFDASRWTYGKVSNTMVRTYVNDKGERLSIMFLNGVPLSEIPAGFYPADAAGQQQMAQQATVGTGEEVAAPEDLGHDEDGRDNAISNGRVPSGQEDPNDKGEVDPTQNYYSATSNQLMDMYNEAKATADGGGLMDKLGNAPGLIGGVAKVASGIAQGQAITKMEAIATAATERGLDIAPDLTADAETYTGNRTKGQEWFGGTVDGVLKTHATGFQNMPYDVAIQNNPDLAVDGATTPTPTGEPSYSSEAPPPVAPGNGSISTTPLSSPIGSRGESTFSAPTNAGQQPAANTPSTGLSFGSTTPYGGELRPADINMTSYNPSTRVADERGESPFSFGDTGSLPAGTTSTDLPLGRPVAETNPDRYVDLGSGFEMDMGVTITDNNTGQSTTVPTSTFRDPSGGGESGGLSFTRGTPEEDGRDNNESNGNTPSETSSAGARGVGSETTQVRDPANDLRSREELSGHQSTNPGGFDREEGNWASGPFARGGLVARRAVRPTTPRRKIRTVER